MLSEVNPTLLGSCTVHRSQTGCSPHVELCECFDIESNPSRFDSVSNLVASIPKFRKFESEMLRYRIAAMRCTNWKAVGASHVARRTRADLVDPSTAGDFDGHQPVKWEIDKNIFRPYFTWLCDSIRARICQIRFDLKKKLQMRFDSR